MKHSHKIFCIVAGMLLLISCNKTSYYEVNPNTPSTATPALLLASISYNVFYPGSMDRQGYASRFITYYQDANVVEQTYGWTTASYTSASYNNYTTLNQVEDMNTRAQSAGQVNYQGLAHFFRAVLFSQLTETYGDVPYSQALQALNGIPTPKYDVQENIYAGILKELDTANAMLDPTQGELGGDIIYGGAPNEILQWKQLVNAFHMRLLIHLSKKVGSTTIDVVQQFQDILSDPVKYPLMTSISDNAQLVFNTSAANNNNPFYQNLTIQTTASMEEGLVDTLIKYNDPRLFSYASPVSGLPANVFSSYVGINAGLQASTQQTLSGLSSRLNSRYWISQTNEPYIFLSYAEQEFLIAEAISRGWVTTAGTADTYYNNGITASMKFYGIDDGTIATYLAQPLVQFNAANALTMITIQKYISFYLNSFWEPFFEYRRTGLPTLNVGPGTLNNELVPKRWLYPQNEYAINAANVNAAVQVQYGGVDDINGVMWVLQ
jgi:Starch-binding associating with outer membrane